MMFLVTKHSMYFITRIVNVYYDFCVSIIFSTRNFLALYCFCI